MGPGFGMFPGILLGLAGLAAAAAASSDPDLGTVLSKNGNLSTYYGLLKVGRDRRERRLSGEAPRESVALVADEDHTGVSKHHTRTAQLLRRDGESKRPKACCGVPVHV